MKMFTESPIFKNVFWITQNRRKFSNEFLGFINKIICKGVCQEVFKTYLILSMLHMTQWDIHKAFLVILIIHKYFNN